MSNSEEKVWVHVEAYIDELENELNKLAKGGYQVFKLVPLIAHEGESDRGEDGVRTSASRERLERVHIVAFHLMRFAELQQKVQQESVLKQVNDLAAGAATK